MNLQVALRQQIRRPGFSIAIVVTLALAIGAAAVVLSVVNAVIVRALPFTAPEELVWIASVRSDNPSAPFSLPEFMDYSAQTHTLSGLAAYANWTASLTGEGITERFQGARLSGNAFDVLGISPAAGRLLNPGDDRPGAARVVVLSHRLWHQRFGASPDTVGKTARINGEPFVIVGILPAHFPLPLRGIDVVTALAPDTDPLRSVRNSVNFLRMFGRLQAGTDRHRAQSELTTICAALRQQFPVEYARKQAVRVDPFQTALVGDFRDPLLILLAAVLVVFTTTVANLVALALVRASGRRSEFSIRIAMGASRLQLVRQFALEALPPVIAGCVLGWIVAGVTLGVALRWAPASVPRLDEVALDAPVALMVALTGVVVIALLIVAPLSATSRVRGCDASRVGSRGAPGDRWSHRIRTVIVIAEISAAIVLLLVTSVLVRNLMRLQEVHPGFNTEGVFQARVSIPASYRSSDDVSRFYERFSELLAESPGVRGVGVISVAPLSGLLATVPFSREEESVSKSERASANLRLISERYLSTVETRLLRGRSFKATDRSARPPVALVSAALADRFFAGGAVGRRLLINDNNKGPRSVEIVGVVENVRQTTLEDAAVLDVYLPLRQVHSDWIGFLRNNQFWMVKTSSDPASFRATFLAHLREVDPDAAVSGIGTMRDFIDAWLGPRRFNVAVFAAFALTAVLLAIVGLYGLVSYYVSQRAPELALRLAVGATPRDVQTMVLRQAMVLGTAGVALGVVLARVVQGVASTVLPDASIQLREAAAVSALLIGVALTASWLPARRATRIDPNTLLHP